MRNQHFKTVLVRRKKTFYPTACERWCGTTLFNNIVEALKRTRHERNWKVIARRTTWSNSDQKTMSRWGATVLRRGELQCLRAVCHKRAKWEEQLQAHIFCETRAKTKD